MRYAIVSDIHSNLQAWNAVLSDIATLNIDCIVCLGDVVGYGPHPVEVLKSVHTHVDAIIMGNHDAAVCGKIDSSHFNVNARNMVQWTRSSLGAEALSFLGSLPLMLKGDGFLCSHGDFSAPAAFRYVVRATDAMPSWSAVKEPLLFVGHSHIALIHVIGKSGVPHVLHAEDFIMEPGKRYIVNPGSVGHPRDGGCLASYCIFDSDEKLVAWRQVAFDLDAYRAAMVAANLSPEMALFLEADPRKRLAKMREPVDFAPPENVVEQAQGVKEMDELSSARKRLSKWKIIASIAFLALIALGVLFLISTKNKSVTADAYVRPEKQLAPLNLYPLRGDKPNLLPVIPEIKERDILPGWRYALQNNQTQTVGIKRAHQTSAFYVKSEAPGGSFKIESPPLNLGGTRITRARLRGRIKKSDDFRGNVWVMVEQFGDTENNGKYILLGTEQKDFRRKQADGWFATQHTFDVRRTASFLRFTIQGEFSGEIDIADLELEPVVLSP